MSIWLDTAPALDRQTDGRTELVKQYHALYAWACCRAIIKLINH